MNETNERPEFKIPKSWGDPVLVIVGTVFVILTASAALINLFSREAIIASSIWLILVGFLLWASFKEAGLRKAVIVYFGYLVGRKYVESTQIGTHPAQIYFGYLILGRRFILNTLAIDKIESVEWNPGQGTSMAGRDMKDWHVCLWFDHNDSTKSERQKMLRKPGQDILIVGPSGPEENTEAFGLLFVDFLRKAGAQLEQDHKNARFVRHRAEKNEETIK